MSEEASTDIQGFDVQGFEEPLPDIGIAEPLPEINNLDEELKGFDVEEGAFIVDEKPRYYAQCMVKVVSEYQEKLLKSFLEENGMTYTWYGGR